MKLSALLKQARRIMRLSQERMASLLGVGQSTYSTWESDERTPRSDNSYHALCVLCDELMRYYSTSIGRIESRLDILLDIIIKKRKNYHSSTSKEDNQIALGVFMHFADAYAKKVKHPLTTTKGQGIKQAKLLLAAHSPETVKKTIDTFFAYDKRTRYSWNAFMGTFDNILPHAGGVKSGGYAPAKCPYCERVMPDHAPDCPTQNVRKTDG